MCQILNVNHEWRGFADSAKTRQRFPPEEQGVTHYVWWTRCALSWRFRKAWASWGGDVRTGANTTLCTSSLHPQPPAIHKGVHGAKPGWWRDRRIEESENGQWKRRISYHRHSRNQDFELSEPYERNQAQGNSHFASAGSFPLLRQLTSDPVISDSPAE